MSVEYLQNDFMQCWSSACSNCTDGPEENSSKLLSTPFVEDPQHRLKWTAYLEFTHNNEVGDLTWDKVCWKCPRAFSRKQGHQVTIYSVGYFAVSLWGGVFLLFAVHGGESSFSVCYLGKITADKRKEKEKKQKEKNKKKNTTTIGQQIWIVCALVRKECALSSLLMRI